MSKRRILLAAIVLGAAIAAYALLLGPSDEQRVRYQLTRLATSLTVSDDTGTNPIAHLAHVNSEFAEIFDEDVRVHIPELTSLGQGRGELARIAAQAPMQFRSLKVSFEDVSIKFDGSGRDAHVEATANLRATRRDGGDASDRRAVTFQAVKRDGSWRISTVQVWPSAG